MIDAVTQERIVLLGTGTGNPYLIIPEAQLASITDMLRDHNVPHWVDDDLISIDGEPEVAFVTLGRNADAAEVQRLIDAI